MINESKGTPNIVREIINDNHVNINNIIYGFKSDTELTHLYELYQIRDTFDKSSWVKSRSLNTFDRL